MIAYVDSSVLARAYLIDEAGHTEAVALLEDSDMALFTGTWTRIEVSGALVRAARAGHGDESGLLDMLDGDLGVDGPVSVVDADRHRVEAAALELVRTHAIRAMDAWHLAVADLTIGALAEPGEMPGFATRNKAQASVAATLGFTPI